MRVAARQEGERWLAQALVDVHWCQRLAEQGGHYLVCFLSQQAAEKALKAVLYAQGEELVLGHSVRQLSQRVAAVGEPFAAQVGDWSVLDTYYLPTRYPSALPDDIPARVYNARAAQTALSLSEQVVQAVQRWFDGAASS